MWLRAHQVPNAVEGWIAGGGDPVRLEDICNAATSLILEEVVVGRPTT
jgi:hypothetical protein